MEDTKKFIQEHFAIGYTYDLNSLGSNELKFISDYMTYLGDVRGNLKIVSISIDDTKLDIQVKGGICFFY